MKKAMVVTATEFKAKCLALLDEVEQHGTAITVTKRGRAVATVGPSTEEKWDSLKGRWAGKVRIVGDIVNSDPDIWDCARGE
jgi:prevent-host-death family protein